MAKNTDILKQAIEHSNIDEYHKKELISLVNQNKLEKLLKLIYRLLGIGKHLKDITDSLDIDI